MRLETRFLPWLALLAALAPTAEPRPAFGQVGGWQKIEGAEETRKYQDEARVGPLGKESIAWLRETVLPQLTVAGNRSTVERSRRRMHDAFLNERIFDAAALQSANPVAVSEMMKLARNPDSTPLARINALLLVGELRGKDGRPWPEALPPLATAVGDAKLPSALRVAAAVGLARHADAARVAGGGDFGRIAGPALEAVIATPPADADPAGSDWLVSRALELLPVGVPQATPATAAALVRIVDDQTRTIDVRVRAAVALGATAGTNSKVEAGRLIASIRALGTAALAADIDRAEQRSFDRSLAAPAAADRPGGGQPPGDAANSAPRIEPLVVRRAAWRLAVLADAIARSDGQGLVRLVDPNVAAAARAAAESCRKGATDLDSAPDLATCRRVLTELRENGGAAGAPPGAATDNPANAARSPFDN